jgi:hypothetical protein
MSFKATIATIDRTDKVLSAHITLPLNERATALVQCVPDFVPTRLQEIQLYAADQTTLLFGGIITHRNLQGIESAAGTPYCELECSDFWLYADQAQTSLVYTADVTLKQVLTDLVAGELGDFGITLDAGQVDGPTLAAFAFEEDTYVSDALRQLMERAAGFVCRISATKTLKAFLLGTEAAPYTVTDLQPHCHSISWTDGREMPANRVVLVCGPSSGAFLYRGFQTSDGVATSWKFDVQGDMSPWTIIVGGEFVDITDGIGSGGRYEWDRETFTLHAGTDGVPPNGTIFNVTYWVNYPFEIIRATGGTPVITRRVLAPDIVAGSYNDPPHNTSHVFAAMEAADNYLDLFDQSPRELTLFSYEHGWLPGQIITLDVPTRSFVGSAYITVVEIDLNIDQVWTFTVSATESDLYPGSYLDEWRELLAGGGGGGSPITVSPPVAGNPGGPFRAVQYNNNGIFGGSDHFKFFEEGASLAVGQGSTITAANPRSCFAIGDDCHVEDP